LGEVTGLQITSHFQLHHSSGLLKKYTREEPQGDAGHFDDVREKNTIMEEEWERSV
jgi:hypothetical protein